MNAAATGCAEPRLLPPRHEMVRAFQASDASYDGLFFTAVRTTGVFCRPSCRPPRPPHPDHVEFFATVTESLEAGYRPCKLCHPQTANGGPPDWVAPLMARIEADPTARWRAQELRTLGVTPERVRRWFHENHGLSFTAWLRQRRLGVALNQLRQGKSLDDVALGHGFESHSGFREAFARTFGTTPGRATTERPLTLTTLESPLGALLAGTLDEGLCLLTFRDRRSLPDLRRELQRNFTAPVIPGTHPLLDQLQQELGEYFAGRRREFTVPLAPQGTPFQIRVWTELQRIPTGETLSYQGLADRIGQRAAVRAVARANGDNRIVILIPCHRVIGKNGTLTGYGGGLWRKRLLLELERTGRWP